MSILLCLHTMAATPVIPDTFTADVVAVSSGTAPGVPKGTQSFTQFYDYTNKRLRKDFHDQGYAKVYRYDKLIQPRASTPHPPRPRTP